MNNVSGTFTETGNTEWVRLPPSASISLVFAGTATVALQRRFKDGAAKTVESFTQSYEGSIPTPGYNVEYRLSCTAHTNNVDYWLG